MTCHGTAGAYRESRSLGPQDGYPWEYVERLSSLRSDGAYRSVTAKKEMMMKKKTLKTKLSLAQTTIRVLTTNHLQEVVGGTYPTLGCTGPAASCQCSPVYCEEK